MKEKWLPVIGYEGVYSVSNLGRLRRDKLSLGTYKGRILKSSKRAGYHLHGLSNNGKSKTLTLHKIVMESFINKCPKGKEINHIDGNKSNNKLENLEYVTKLENMLHAKINGLIKRGEKNGKSKIKSKDVIKIRELFLKTKNKSEVSRKLKITLNIINNVINKRTWRHI